MTAVWIGKQDQEHAVRLEAHLVEIENGTYRFNTPVTAARTPHDDVERPGPDETVDRLGQATRRRMLVRANGLVIGRGLTVGDG